MSAPETAAPNPPDAERLAKARQIAATPGAVRQVAERTFAVRSQTGVGEYRVDLDAGVPRDNCPDTVKHEGVEGFLCKHDLAVLELLAGGPTRAAAEIRRSGASPARAWGAYNRAQEEEGRLFSALLAEIAPLVEDPRAPQVLGQPRLPLADMVFCAATREYHRLSMRRSNSQFGAALAGGTISRVPKRAAISAFLCDPAVTPVLQRLVTLSAGPLLALEDGYAVDSTGLRTTDFGYWREDKHGERRRRGWVKFHALSGVRTHAVLAALLTANEGEGTSDYANAEPLMRHAADMGLRMEGVPFYADKGYSGRSIYRLCEEFGLAPWIPFKRGATPKPTVYGRRLPDGRKGPGGSSRLWTKAFWYFRLHREEFDARYHQRSNAESTFSSFKRQFGEELRGRSLVSQTNEALCEVIAHNVVAVIHAIFEGGAVPDFAGSLPPEPSGDESAPAAAVAVGPFPPDAPHGAAIATAPPGEGGIVLELVSDKSDACPRSAPPPTLR